jgi:steroid delta-isomerase-like uncharacterized protein
MTTANRVIINRWFDEVWNKGNAAAIDELLAPDVKIHGLNDSAGDSVDGVEPFKIFHQNFRNAFPDIQVILDDVIAEGDKVVGRCTVRETHTGDGLGISPTNRAVEFTGICIVRVEDGKIKEAWNNFDFLAMFQQLGVNSFPS